MAQACANACLRQWLCRLQRGCASRAALRKEPHPGNDLPMLSHDSAHHPRAQEQALARAAQHTK